MKLKPVARRLEQLRRTLEARIRVRSAQAKKASTALSRLLTAREQVAHRIGRVLAQIRNERLYANLGHRTFGSFIASLRLGRTQAFKWIAIATALSEDEAASLGTEAAYRQARKTTKTKLRK